MYVHVLMLSKKISPFGVKTEEHCGRVARNWKSIFLVMTTQLMQYKHKDGITIKILSSCFNTLENQFLFYFRLG